MTDRAPSGPALLAAPKVRATRATRYSSRSASGRQVRFPALTERLGLSRGADIVQQQTPCECRALRECQHWIGSHSHEAAFRLCVPATHTSRAQQPQPQLFAQVDPRSP